jgi:retron-type reverse transcriptase
LAHLIDVPALRRAYGRIRRDGAVGVDGVTKDQFGRDLEVHLQDLHERLKSKRYRHQPIRRVHIPKGQGKTRPIGISAFEDKVVQDAVREVLEAIYEQDFLDCSFGFRPKRGAHGAIRALNRMADRGETNWILEADIQSFFDSVDRTKLMEMLQVRVADGVVLGDGGDARAEGLQVLLHDLVQHRLFRPAADARLGVAHARSVPRVAPR